MTINTTYPNYCMKSGYNFREAHLQISLLLFLRDIGWVFFLHLRYYICICAFFNGMAVHINISNKIINVCLLNFWLGNILHEFMRELCLCFLFCLYISFCICALFIVFVVVTYFNNNLVYIMSN